MTTGTRVPAVGGTRTVPEPDAIARDYLLLALRLEQHVPGLVDAYYGPASLKAQVDMEQRRSPAALAADARALLDRVAGEVGDPARRAWLEAQVVALEANASALLGSDLSYEERVARSFDITPTRVPDDVVADAERQLDGLLPGTGDLAARLAAWDRGLQVPEERLLAVADWLVERFRARSETLFGLPAGERVSVSVVRNQPWPGYNWYEGGLRSRVDLNRDLPIQVPRIAEAIAHEAFPGHHLEHAWKEVDLVEAGRVECSALVINTPECLVSEGLANLGFDVVSPAAEGPALIEELLDRSAVPAAADPGARGDVVERALALRGPRNVLRASVVNAAVMLHVDRAPRDAVVDYLVRVAHNSPDVAANRIAFIEHPLWRVYAFTYSDGTALLRRWVHGVDEVDRPARFARLLHEQLTPGTIRAELGESAA